MPRSPYTAAPCIINLLTKKPTSSRRKARRAGPTGVLVPKSSLDELDVEFTKKRFRILPNVVSALYEFTGGTLAAIFVLFLSSAARRLIEFVKFDSIVQVFAVRIIEYVSVAFFGILVITSAVRSLRHIFAEQGKSRSSTKRSGVDSWVQEQLSAHRTIISLPKGIDVDDLEEIRGLSPDVIVEVLEPPKETEG
jgi:hypothetical protein